MQKSLLLGALFLASLVLTAACIRQFLPFPRIEGIEPKLAWLAQHGDAYDTLFIGSSRIFWQVIPREFDAAMAEAGEPTRSFNLGYKSMRPPEDSYVLEEALKARKGPLRFVVVEADEIALETRDDTAGTSRLAYWHDPRRMWSMMAQAMAAIETDAGWWENLDERRDAFRQMGSHIIPFLMWATNLGRGEPLVSSTLPQRDWNNLVGNLRDGFTEEKTGALTSTGAKRYRSDLKRSRNAPEVATEARQQLYGEMERRIVAVGAQMILVIPPRMEAGAILPDPKRFPQVPVFDFSDPTRYPDLFEARDRNDPDHLNLQGSTLFTRQLAARVMRLKLAARAQP